MKVIGRIEIDKAYSTFIDCDILRVYKHSEDEWACALNVISPYKKQITIHGISAESAIKNSFIFIETMISRSK